MKTTEICYLCGEVIDLVATEEGEKITRDHFPPRVFFPKNMREKGAFKNLETFPTHQKCNASFKEDEEYVARVMSLFVGDKNSIGGALLTDFGLHAQSHPEHSLVLKNILQNVSSQMPSGLYMPPGKFSLNFYGDRVERVFWKIARGLYFRAFGRVLPYWWIHRLGWVIPGEKPPEWLLEFYPKIPATVVSNMDVFIWKYGHNLDPMNLSHIMIMRFWKCFIVHVSFHDIGCRCDPCKQNRTYEAEHSIGLKKSAG